MNLVTIIILLVSFCCVQSKKAKVFSLVEKDVNDEWKSFKGLHKKSYKNKTQENDRYLFIKFKFLNDL